MAEIEQTREMTDVEPERELATGDEGQPVEVDERQDDAESGEAPDEGGMSDE